MTTSQTFTNEWYPIEDAIYLETAAHSVMPRVSKAAIEASIAANMNPYRVDHEGFFELSDRLRKSIAKLICANPREIALTTGASNGLQVIAHNLAWERGDGVIFAEGDFPLQYATWKPMEQRAGIAVTLVRPRGEFLAADDIIEAITPKTRLVSLSQVRWDDGSLLDIPRIAAACRAHGALLVVDICQSCGAVPVDVQTLGADAIVGAGYKWLLGPYGTGFMWINDTLREQLLPGPFYWTGQKAELTSDLNFLDPEPSRSAKCWDSPETALSLNPNLMAMCASIELVLRIGPDVVLQHSRDWIDRLFELLPQGCTPVSPLNPRLRGPFGSISSGGKQETAALYERLRLRGIYTSLRQGKIRIAPHLFNSIEQVSMVIDALSEFTGR